MAKAICVYCQTEFKIIKTGAYVIDMFLQPPQPYKIWSADVWGCPRCGKQIVQGFGSKPLYEHFEENFKENLDRILGSKNEDDWVLFNYEKPVDFIMADDSFIQKMKEIFKEAKHPVFGGLNILQKGGDFQ